jgi:hypothetical protein
VDVEDHILSSRLAEFLRDQYPQGAREKQLARDIGCEPRTAKNILNNYWPSARHLRAIVRRFGQDVITAVFTPDIEPEAARLAKEVRDLEDKLAQANARLKQVAGSDAGYPRRVAQHPLSSQKTRRRA